MSLPAPGSTELSRFVFDARPDTIDFRDHMYMPSLVEIPTRIELDEYLAYQAPVLNQGVEGACTGYGLATVANYLLRRRKIFPDATLVSPWMLYEMARRYDEWPGENYHGSSARGAMKGWHKHGVCAEEIWPGIGHDNNRENDLKTAQLTHTRLADAATRPLGAYYRVNHTHLTAMHSALAEVGVLYATAWVHTGWTQITLQGQIPFEKEDRRLGVHAFAIVAYDQQGFWLQNSWGETWGKGGFARLGYSDWLANGLDVWVARLGVPVQLRSGTVTIAARPAQAKSGLDFSEYSMALHPHIISLTDQGALQTEGPLASPEAEIEAIFKTDLPRLTKDWRRKRLLLFAPNGLVDRDTFIQRAIEYRNALMQAEIYPIIFNWKSDFWSTITDVLQNALRRRRPDENIGGNMDFMLDRLDDTLEPLARNLLGKTHWGSIKAAVNLATAWKDSALPVVLSYMNNWFNDTPNAEIHLVAHSLGGILAAPLTRLLTSRGRIRKGQLSGKTGFALPVKSCTLWAPASKVETFDDYYLPAIQNKTIQQFTLYTLNDQAELDDHVARIYNKSLLYLISNALEEYYGQALLGLEKSIQGHPSIMKALEQRRIEWVRAPNTAPLTGRYASTAATHGAFDDDEPTLHSTLARILQPDETSPEFDFSRSRASLREKRKQLDLISRGALS